MDRKIILSVALCALVGTASAAVTTSQPMKGPSSNGFYVGAKIGYADSTYKQSDFDYMGLTATKLDHSGFAGRVNVGYLFTPNFAVEVGGLFLPQVHWTYPSDDIRAKNRYLVDLFVKGILPLQHNFSIFGKAGLAWYHETNNGTGPDLGGTQEYTDNAVIPALGAGVSYNFNSQLSADLDYTYYFGTGNATNVVTQGSYFAGTHFIGVGLTYKFGA